MWPHVTALFFANLLTLVFVYGCWQLRHIKEAKDAKSLALAAFALPLLFAAIGFLV